jgi:lysophospholipase L1-like esterase
MKLLLACTIIALSLFASIAAISLAQPPQRQLTPEQQAERRALQEATRKDHQQMLEQLKITSLRPGANPNDPKAPNAVNYDEAKANPYPKLPDPLVLKNGKRVTSAKVWWDKRRPEIVEDFDREVYGRVPKNVPAVKWKIVSTVNETKFGIPVTTKQIVGHIDNSAYPEITVDIQLTLTTPANALGPVPVMMEFGFPRRPANAPDANRPAFPEPTWQRQLFSQGWSFASLIPASIQPDNGAGLTSGIIGLVNKGQPRKPDDWGALRAWAWGASRALDYLETDKAVNARQVGIEGLSRYGKAALVAMAYDQRFAIGFIGSSGEGGAKLHRRTFGELVENLTGSGGYHWMAGNFIKYGGPLTAGDLPVDAHELIALCAPRPTFISYGAAEGPGAEGKWVDQRGSFMAAVAAGPVFRLLGKKDIGTAEFPAVDTALIDGDLAWRQHSGGHTVVPNWPAFLTFAGRYIKGAELRTGSPDQEKPAGSADQPVHRKEDQVWLKKHHELLEKARKGGIDLYFEGDSITRRWEADHKANWDLNFGGWRPGNFGAGGDRTQNVLYRLENGELDGVNPKVIVLLIGTNNVGFVPVQGSDEALVEDVTRGIKACLDVMRKKASNAKILLMGITPRNTNGSTALMPTINRINERIAKLADDKTIRFLNINDKLADKDGKLYEGMTNDGLHLIGKGYQVWADAMKPILTEWLGPPAK